MVTKATRRLRSQTALLCGVSAAAVIALAPGDVVAQEAAVASGSTEIVVTGTRIIRDGYQAPTPTSVIGAQEIAAKAPANIADLVNQLPSLAGSTTPQANIASLSTGLIGINALNLRNLGANRTLVLLDGKRVAASTLSGLVDVNQFPQQLIKRVDVVTGGASADWGSDAVAGVVNFVLDKDFTGVKGQVQGGLTTYGDDRTYNVSLTAGTRFANDRGHVLLSFEDAYNGGVSGVPRGWYNGNKMFFNPAYTPTNGQPQLLVSPNTGFATATPGGIITSGPLQGTYFGPGGTPAKFNYGPIVSAPFMQGGDWQYADFAKSGDLDPKQTRQNYFTRVSYDLTDHLQIFGQGSYGRATSQEAALTQFNFGNITIRRDNAFIPASVAAQVNALNLASFTLGSFNQDLGPSIATTVRSSLRGLIGASGDFDALGSNWTWDAYGQRSVNRTYTAGILSITANYQAAIDSVRDSSGNIVCRSTLTNPANGCVPYNIMGIGVNSQAARNYVLGTSWGRNLLTEDVLAGNLHGNPFSNWAGPISVAAGVEHRREAVRGSNDPLSSTNSYFAGNYHASFGAYHVTEGYFETVVPLAKDLSFAKSLDFNGAVRATSYSTSGDVTTWKIGLTYSPIDDITFRATRSRDIRAPNLAELFQAGQTSTTSLADPFRGNAITTAFQVTQGNLNLKPEEADSLGVGAILRPRFLPGFTVSADYYDIRINDAISTVNAPTLVNQCFLGNTALCSQILRNSSGALSSVLVQPVNLAKQIARGIDFEASYRRPFLDGDLTLRVLATHYLKNYANDGITPPTDTVGTNGTNGTARNSLPNWRYLATVGWDNEDLALMFTARGISDGVYNTSYIQCTSGCPTSTVANMTINNNHVPGAIYFDTNITFKLPRQIEAFLAVDNIANTSPVQVAYGTSVGAAPLSVNPLLYDILGRTFRMGLRFKM
ncbi:MAG: hypothetical protein JWM77_1248 [Rhodospirillales bacterium]|nr:hypothetical protein [Rhodospirillales bacterium]